MPKQLLKQNGPSLTSVLATELRLRDEISQETARKRIQRAIESGEIKTLDNVNFAHNQSFAFLPEHNGTRLFHERLFEAMTEAKSALRLPLAAMRARGGSIPASMFPTFSGLPIESKFKQHSGTLKKNLLDLGFLTEEGDLLHLAHDSQKYRITPAHMQGRINAENALLVTFADWLKRQRLVGNQMTFRSGDQVPQSCGFQWDFVAPSYVAPLATREKGKATPGFIVCDVILGRSVTAHEVQYFIEKCASIRSHPTNRPIMAFLICDWFDQEALNLAQSTGVIFTTPKNLFGSNFAEALESFRKVLEEKETIIEQQAAKISALLEKIDKLEFVESLKDNLRGELFELIVGHCYGKLNLGTIELGRKFKDLHEDKSWDCDVLQVHYGMALRGCECKGYRGTTKVDVEVVKKWFSKIVPIIRKHFGVQDYPQQEFSIWTSGEFEDNAVELLKELSSKTKKFKISWKDGTELSKIVEQVGDPSIKQSYKRWFKPISATRQSVA